MDGRCRPAHALVRDEQRQAVPRSGQGRDRHRGGPLAGYRDGGRAEKSENVDGRSQGANTMKPRLVLISVLAALFAAAPALAADAPVGKWKTVDDKTGKVESEVEIYQEGGKLF